MNEPLLLNTADAAAMLGIAPRTLKKPSKRLALHRLGLRWGRNVGRLLWSVESIRRCAAKVAEGAVI